MEKSWKEAIKKVLAESDMPLHYTEISEQILSCGYYETDGATPAATVNAQLASSIKHESMKAINHLFCVLVKEYLRSKICRAFQLS